MKYFETPVQILLPQTAFAKAAEFADAVVKTVNYRDSLQYNTTKIRDDHFISKLGEEAVKQVFEPFTNSIQGPDYSIYNGKQKSWESDLYVNKIPLAVKKHNEHPPPSAIVYLGHFKNPALGPTLFYKIPKLRFALWNLMM